jgi:thioredoxin reductase (NADPH)
MPDTPDTSGGGQPRIVAIDDEDAPRARIVAALERRFGADYRVVGHASPRAALEDLDRLRHAGEQVAVVLADQWMDGLTGTEVLERVNALFPLARRGLLVKWGAWTDPTTTEAILNAMGRGAIDYYVLKPWHSGDESSHSPDEYFYRTIAEFLHEWSRSGAATPQQIVVVAKPGFVRTNELRSLLARNGVPFGSLDPASPEGRRVLAAAGADGSRPVVRMLDGSYLVDPSNTEFAGAYGLHTRLEGSREFDVLVVGAGPAGLAAAVYASSEGLRTLVVEGEAIGGQAGTSSLIRNYLGFSRGVRGGELAQRAYQQAWVFGTRFLHTRRVTGLVPTGDCHTASISDGTTVTARAVVLATGVSYRRVENPAIEQLTGAGVFYGSSVADAHALADEDVYVVGGGNSAGQAAMHLCRHARSVTLLVRSGTLADSMSQYLRDQLEAASKISVRLRSEVANAGGEGRLEWLELRDREAGTTERVEARGLFILIGARPRTEWLGPEVERDPWGYVVTGTDLASDGGGEPARPPLIFETSLPGLFAVGDVRYRSVKRVASAVGEGSVAVQQVHQYLATRAEGGDAPVQVSDAALESRADPGRVDRLRTRA